MTLDDFLQSTGTSAVDFAARIGVSTGSLSRIRRGEQNITRDTIRAIVRESGGAVTAEEIVGVEHVTGVTIGEARDHV